jgi:phage minor structural protein
VAFSIGGDTLIEILDRQLNRIAILENAYGDGYEKRWNEVGSMWFNLPLDDPKNEHCNPFNFVRYTLDDENVGLYRIVPKYTRKDSSNNQIEYECRHVIHTLVDSVLFRYHQTTNWTTRQNIEYILSKQKVQHWVLGECEFTRYFSYNFENENGLLAPLLSIPQPFDEEWEWTYNTTVYPFVLNLVKPSTTPSCVIREAHNRIGIEKEEPNEIFNRFYPLGYGEGVNQLGIEEVNNGIPYVEDTESIAKYGLQEVTWIDRRFEKAEELKANAESLLKQKANPVPMYRISAADVSPITGEEIDKLKCGSITRIYDSDLGIFDLRIMSEVKNDARGNPGDIQLEVGSLTEDLATVQADLERKLQVNEAYSQGATNIDTYSYNDNCDAENPAVIRFYLPDELVNINKLELTYEPEAFRAYSKATLGGGGTSTTSGAGGGTSTTSGAGGGTSTTSGSGGGATLSSSNVDFNGATLRTGTPIGGELAPYEFHEHYVTVVDNQLQHSHSVTVNPHSHTITLSPHSHTITLESHDHSITLEPHVHGIEYGIYKDSSVTSSWVVEVDGNLVSETSDRINIIPYLSKDEGGRVLRGQWHEVTIKPNSGLGRVNANIFGQYFLQSRGGGTY